MPLGRRQPVDADILGIGEAIAAELLDLPQLHELVPLAVAQQKCPIILLPLAFRRLRAHCQSSLVAGCSANASPLTSRSLILWATCKANERPRPSKLPYVLSLPQCSLTPNAEPEPRLEAGAT